MGGFCINTKCAAKMTLQGPDDASTSTVTTYEFPEHPATGIMRCVVDSTGRVGNLTFSGTTTLIDLPSQSNLHLTTSPNSTNTQWQPRKQVLTNHWVIPMTGQLVNGSMVLCNPDQPNTQGFWLKGLPTTASNNVVTIEIAGSVVSFDPATAQQSGSFSAQAVVIDNSSATSFSSKWSTAAPPMLQSNTPLLVSGVPLSLTLIPAGSGTNQLDCNVVPVFRVSNANMKVHAVVRITTSAILSDYTSVVSETATG